MSTTERQRLEQEALQQLNRGSTEGALKAYMAILKLDPRDRRIRQKVGEILLRQGRVGDAEKHLREVAEGLIRDGSHRAAVAVLKQLVGIRPDAPELHFDLGECYVSATYVTDAKACFELASKLWISMGKPVLAANAARRLAELAPGELALRLRTAELLESGSDNDGAAAVYAEVIEEYRRRGRLDEVGRVAEMALRVKPDDVSLLLDAASGRVAAGDYKRALQALQTAFLSAPKEPRTLDLLAKAFEGAGQADRAMKVLLELARVLLERGNHAGEVDALRRALALAPNDEDTAARLDAAADRLGRFEKTLGSLTLSEPLNEAEARVIVRAEVFVRYGLLERAEAEVRAGAGQAQDSLAILASLAEVMIATGRKAEALAALERILPRAGAESDQVLERMAVVRGVSDVGEMVEDEPLGSLVNADVAEEGFPGVAIEPANEEIGFSEAQSGGVDDDEGDRLARAGDFGGAILAWRAILAEDPLNDVVLGKIAALRTAVRSGTPVAPPTAPPKPAASPRAPQHAPAPPAAVAATEPRPAEGTFAEIEPEIVDDDPSDVGLSDARQLLAQGRSRDALALVQSLPGLTARVVEAQALRALGELNAALDVLRQATNSAAEDDPAYPEALFDLATIYLATGKQRSAMRLLEEVRDLAPAFRPGDIAATLDELQNSSR